MYIPTFDELFSQFLASLLQGSVGTQSPLFDIGLSPTLAMFSIGYESALQAVTGNGRVNSFGQVEVFSISSSGGFFQLSHVEDIDANPSTLQ